MSVRSRTRSVQHIINLIRGHDAVRPFEQGIGIGLRDALQYGIGQFAEFAMKLTQEDGGYALLATLLAAFFA